MNLQAIQLHVWCSYSANLFKLTTTLHGWLIKLRLIALVNTVGAFIREAHTVSTPAPACEPVYYFGIEEAKGNKQHPLWSTLVWLGTLIHPNHFILKKNSLTALSPCVLLILAWAVQLVCSQEKVKPKQMTRAMMYSQADDLTWKRCRWQHRVNQVGEVVGRTTTTK